MSVTITLENTEGAIKNEQSRETGITCHTRRRKTKQKQYLLWQLISIIGIFHLFLFISDHFIQKPCYIITL
jgi:hypothetical protein